MLVCDQLSRINQNVLGLLFFNISQYFLLFYFQVSLFLCIVFVYNESNEFRLAQKYSKRICKFINTVFDRLIDCWRMNVRYKKYFKIWFFGIVKSRKQTIYAMSNLISTLIPNHFDRSDVIWKMYNSQYAYIC